MLHAKENDTVNMNGDEGKDKVLALEIRLNQSPAERIWQWKKFNKFILCATVSCFPLLLKNVASLVPRGVKGPCCWDDVTHIMSYYWATFLSGNCFPCITILLWTRNWSGLCSQRSSIVCQLVEQSCAGQKCNESRWVLQLSQGKSVCLCIHSGQEV